jgi:hypothetical protein
MKDTEKNMQKINYNKSDTNLKIPVKSGSASNLKKFVNPIEDIDGCVNKYEPHNFGKWRFIPVRN